MAAAGVALGLPGFALATPPPTLYVAGSRGFDAGAATDTGNNCQTESTPCATLGNAVAQAVSGTTIEISGTVSDAGISIGLNLTLTDNPDGSGATIQGSAGDATGLLTITGADTVVIAGLTLEDGKSTAQYGGGAITSNAGGQITVENSTLADNTGGNGGAIDNNDSSGDAGSVTIRDSTLYGNSGADGGAIDNNDHSTAGTGSMTITNSTLYGNSGADGGAIDNDDNRGSGGSVTITDSTLAADTASQFGALIDNAHYSSGGSIYVAADVLDGGCVNSGSWTDAGYNAASDSSCLGASPAGTDAAVSSAAGDLGALTANGGTTSTQALALGNPAIGLLPSGTSFTTGPSNTVAVVCPITADQRGVASVSGGACDAGAVQYLEQTLSFGAGIPTTVVVGQSGVSVSASSTSGLTPGFSVDGTLTTNAACTLAGTAVSFAHAGTCVIDASQAGNPNFAAATTIADTITVTAAATATSLADPGGILTAAVSAVAPGGGTPSGTVTFTVNGQNLGSANLSGGAAELAYPGPAGGSVQVSATYQGSSDYSGSHSSALSVAAPVTTTGGTPPPFGSSPTTGTTTPKPSITAQLSSRGQRSHSRWWTTPVTVTFSCAANGATLSDACPAPVTLDRSGRDQQVTRTITTTDGQQASVTVGGINIDLLQPRVRIVGPAPHHTYLQTAPSARCVASERVSGIRSCKLSEHRTHTAHGYLLLYTARATSNAGTTRTLRISVRVTTAHS